MSHASPAESVYLLVLTIKDSKEFKLTFRPVMVRIEECLGT